MQKFTPEDTVNFGVASSAIKHTLHGDGNITDDVSLIRHVMQMNFDIKDKGAEIMKTIEEQFQKLGVVPVVVLEDKKDAIPLAKALSEGGLPCAEVTFRTDAAAESIRLISETYPDIW